MIRKSILLVIVFGWLIFSVPGCTITVSKETVEPVSTATVTEGTVVPEVTLENGSSVSIDIPTPIGKPLISLPDLTPVVEKIAPAVVLITTEAVAYDFWQRPFPEEGAGTGVIFDARGYIVTNNHVVIGIDNDIVDMIKVSLIDGRSFDVDTDNNVWTDLLSDLAVIKIEGDNLPVAEFANPATILPYQWVLAIGYPFNLEGEPTVTTGIISATGRSIKESNEVVLYDMIQTDTAINPGNSGGPLVNLAGQVIGINTALISGSQNIGFSISVSTVLPVVHDLVAHKYVIRPWLGIYMDTVDEITAPEYGLEIKSGVYLIRIVAGSPAEQAGLQAGDVIIKVDETDISDREELRRLVQSHKIGDAINITYIRSGNTMNCTVILEQTPAP